jgi:hypothetical protein
MYRIINNVHLANQKDGERLYCSNFCVLIIVGVCSSILVYVHSLVFTDLYGPIDNEFGSGR